MHNCENFNSLIRRFLFGSDNLESRQALNKTIPCLFMEPWDLHINTFGEKWLIGLNGMEKVNSICPGLFA
jgi:hypothetical protein